VARARIISLWPVRKKMMDRLIGDDAVMGVRPENEVRNVLCVRTRIAKKGEERYRTYYSVRTITVRVR